MNKLFRSHRSLWVLFVFLIGFGLIACSGEGQTENQNFPEIIQIPTGFAPEGIAIGSGTDFYVGSLNNGAIYEGSIETGEGDILVPGEEGNIAVGLNVDVDRGRLFVSGGATGDARVYDVENGDMLASYTLSTSQNGFINDVIVTSGGAYYTNSSQPVLYEVPFGPDGELPEQNEVREIQLGGEYEVMDGFNSNGIEASADGNTLIVVNSTSGILYAVDPTSGEATAIDLGGETVQQGDGILLDGNTLYVMQNRMNQIAEVELNADWTSGEIVNTITHDAFDVPTTIAQYQDYIYAVNAKFGTDAEGTAYEVVRVSK